MTPEEILRRYYRKVKKIDWLERDIQLLTRQIMELDEKLETEKQIGFEILASHKIVAASGEITQRVPKGLDDTYIIYESQVAKMEKELLEKRTLKMKKEYKVRELRQAIEPIQRIIMTLEPDEQDVLKMTYQEKLSNYYIAYEVGLSEAGVRKKRKHVMQKIQEHL